MTPEEQAEIRRKCVRIESMALELIRFQSIEQMGPATIRNLGRFIQGAAVDIRRTLGEETDER